MPEMHFSVRWPDNTLDGCYSPSLVIKDHMNVGESYSVQDFVQRSRTAHNIATERVRAKYGYACSSAMDQLARIESKAEGFLGDENANVQVERFSP